MSGVSRLVELPKTLSGERTLNSRPDQLVDKLLLDILDDHALSPELDGLGLDSVQVLLLAAIGQKTHNLIVLQNQPSENCTCVKACYVCEYECAILC